MSENQLRADQLPEGAGTGRADVRVIPAASTIVLRGDPYEVLLMRRHERSSFVPGAWVFPGGTLDESDAPLAESLAPGVDELARFKVCALRELFEETGIWPGRTGDLGQLRKDLLAGRRSFAEAAANAPLALDALVWTERWITPVGVPKRFDTYFFLLLAPPETAGTADEKEGVELLWITPEEALARHREGSLAMVFPTIRNLERISGFGSGAALVESRRNRAVRTTLPLLVVDGDRRTIILPEDDGPR